MRSSSDRAAHAMLAGLLAGGLLLTGSIVTAAPQQGSEAPPSRRPGGPAPPAMDEEQADAIGRLLIQRLRRALELTPEQDATVTPLMQELTGIRRQHMQRRREGLRTLAALSQDSAIQEKVLGERLDAFYREQQDFIKEEEQRLAAIRAELTPRQEARLLAFEERFREEIRRRTQEARREGRVQPRRDGPSAGEPRR